MKTLAVILFFALLAGARGEPNFPKTASVRSRSGQFVVFAVPPGAAPSPAWPGLTNGTLTRLDPALLAVSCERIKELLLRELDAPDNWRGKIYLVLHRARNPDETIVVFASGFTDGWLYRMEIPDVVEPSGLTRRAVQTLLLEMANRGARDRSAEIPFWLGEGMAEHLMAASEADLILQPPKWTVNNVAITPAFRETRQADPLQGAKEVLRERPPLSFEELSWPGPELLADGTNSVFRSSAQFFVHELLRLRRGRDCFRAFVTALPQYLNWQTGLWRAFQPHFERPLDLEKWWALKSVHFAARDSVHSWSVEESWRKFDEIVRPGVQVRLGTNAAPLRANVSLQTIIQEWDYGQQARTLSVRIQRLQFLQMRVAPELAPLVSEYRRALQDYLDESARTGAILRGKIELRPSAKRVAQETVKLLDRLDLQRDILRPLQPAPANTARAAP